MATERLNADPAIIPRVLAERLWGESDLFLIDVGASGGIGAQWEVFGDRLRAVGFEPLITEAERLQTRAAGSKLCYEAAFVTCRNFDRLFPPEIRHEPLKLKTTDAFARVSAIRALELMQMNYVEQLFNTGAPARYADRRIVLDEYITAKERETVDFIKIDTDGHDLPVLLGTEELLRDGGVLGFSIETWFNGASHDYANTFSNIDRFLRARGFSLFDLDTYRYSRAALPAPFTYDIPAQTLTGQVMWGEAVYLRDLGMDGYERVWSYDVTRERIVKLACLFDLFGLPDCAAELLITRRDVVGASVPSLLDDLARAAASIELSYEEFIRRFEADPQQLYPSRRAGTSASAASAPAEVAPAPLSEPSPAAEREPADPEALRSRLERQQNKIAVLQERLRRRTARLKELLRERDSERSPEKTRR
jgi:hypothetical protein